MRHEVVERMVDALHPGERAARPMGHGRRCTPSACALFNLDLPVADWAKEEGIGDDEIRERIIQAADAKMAQKAANYGPDIMRLAERSLLLQLLDQIWKDHLLSLDHLRQGINLRAYAQRDPLNEYKREAFELFQDMLVHLREQVTSVLCHVELRVQRPEERSRRRRRRAAHGREPRGSGARRAAPMAATAPRRRPRPRAAAAAPWARTPRNAPCPCGSGKKFKHCHGRADTPTPLVTRRRRQPSEWYKYLIAPQGACD